MGLGRMKLAIRQADALIMMIMVILVMVESKGNFLVTNLFLHLT